MNKILLFILMIFFNLNIAQQGRPNPNLTNPQEKTETSTSNQTSSNLNNKIKNKENKWSLGGNLGLTFGTNTNILIQPKIGYHINQFLLTGINIGYLYNEYKNGYNNSYKNISNLFNFGVFLQPSIKNLYTIIDYEYYTGTHKYEGLNYNSSNDVNEQALWLGAGYKINMGSITSNFGVQYNLLHNNSSVFNTKWMPSAGIMARL